MNDLVNHSSIVFYEDGIRIEPKQYAWKCYLFGGGEDGMVLSTTEENTPNIFWRMMQFLLLGNRWKRCDSSLPLGQQIVKRLKKFTETLSNDQQGQ